MAEERLKLSAGDADDLAVIAACTQDALAPIGEMAFLPAERRFVLALNRFRWDRLDAAKLAARDGDRVPPGRGASMSRARYAATPPAPGAMVGTTIRAVCIRFATHNAGRPERHGHDSLSREYD